MTIEAMYRQMGKTFSCRPNAVSNGSNEFKKRLYSEQQ